MAAPSTAVRSLRRILKELRHTLPDRERSATTSYIMGQYRHNVTTDQQYCREKEEMEYIAKTYGTYIESSRRYLTLYKEYHGQGERTVEETCKMVGFKTPNDPD
ncbi:protein FMC1 homolog isoform X2 [Oratosquilla oratoria]|uniref:protein FMC1 homolog isoform X2 n=1 Tax=Oratosquilla oratoria TaxID=337810 RepID=UPI003F762937